MLLWVLASQPQCTRAPGPGLTRLAGAVVAGHQRTVLKLDPSGVLEVFDAQSLKRLLRCEELGQWEKLWPPQGVQVAVTRGSEIRTLKSSVFQGEQLAGDSELRQGSTIEGLWFEPDGSKLFFVTDKGLYSNQFNLVSGGFSNIGPRSPDTHFVGGHQAWGWAGVRAKDGKLVVVFSGAGKESSVVKEVPIKGHACFAWKRGTLVSGEGDQPLSLTSFPALGPPVVLDSPGPCTRAALDETGTKLFLQSGTRISVWSVETSSAPRQLVDSVECPQAVEAPDFTFAWCENADGARRVELVERVQTKAAAVKKAPAKKK